MENNCNIACDVVRQHTMSYVSMRCRMSAYGVVRRHTMSYVSIRFRTAALQLQSNARLGDNCMDNMLFRTYAQNRSKPGDSICATCGSVSQRCAREWTRANLKSGDNMRVSLPSNAQVNGLALNQAIFYGQYASPCSERCAGDELALT